MKFVCVEGNLHPVDELYHHGVKGMKWGVRRFQNKDGSLTPAGKKRYADKLDPLEGDSSVTKKVKNDYNRLSEDAFKRKYQTSKRKYAKRVEKYGDPYMNSPAAKISKSDAVKKTTKVLSKIGTAYLADQIFFNGAGKKVVASAIKNTGRAFVTAYVMARGGYDIRWYDN